MGNTSRRIRATDNKGNPIPSIYRRTGADGAEQYEITYRDTSGKQHWQRVGGGITAARKALAIRQAQRAEGRQMSTGSASDVQRRRRRMVGCASRALAEHHAGDLSKLLEGTPPVL